MSDVRRYISRKKRSDDFLLELFNTYKMIYWDLKIVGAVGVADSRRK